MSCNKHYDFEVFMGTVVVEPGMHTEILSRPLRTVRFDGECFGDSRA